MPLLILASAAFLRLYRLGEAPPAFNFDEAAHAIDALDILDGHHFIFSPKLGGVESFFMYVVAGAFYLLGPSPYAQRLVSALVGIASVGVTYLMVREMFLEEGEQKRTWLAAFTALGLATSFWHVNYSRIGLEVIMTPFFAALSFYFLWRGLHSNKTRDYVLSGVWLGLAPYTHLPARFLPIPVVLFFIVRWLFSLPSEEARKRSFWHHLWVSFWPLVVIGVVALVVYVPMGYYFLLHPADFLGRSSATSIFNPAMNNGDLWGTLLKSVAGTFGGFGFTSDSNWLANLPGKSILNPVLAVLFWLGVSLSIVRIRRLPYLFVFLTWFTLLIPAVITPERSPHYSRMMIASCVAYIFPALALVALGDALGFLLNLGRTWWSTFLADDLRHSVGYPDKLSPWQKWTARCVRIGVCLAVALLFGWTGVSTYQDYFKVWAKSDVHYMSFDGYAVELTEHMESNTDPRAVYVVPRDIRAGEFYHHYTLDFLHRNGAPHFYVPMDETDVARLLTEASQGKELVYLVKWKMDKHREADPKEYASWLLEKFGQWQSSESFPAYELVIYSLPAKDIDFTLASKYVAVEASFSGKLLLKEVAFGNASAPRLDEGDKVPSGGLVWLILQWERTAPIAEDYRTSIILEDDHGHIIHHKDRDLIHMWHMRTSGWPETETVSDYHLLPVPVETPPGVYKLSVVVYSAQTMERLPLDGKATTEVPLGFITVLPPKDLPQGKLRQPQHSLEGSLVYGLQLRGFDLDVSKPYYPGQEGTLALYWYVTEPLQDDYEMALRLVSDKNPSTSAVWPDARPLGDAYPTTHWLPGQAWRGLYDFRVPPDVTPGSYDLLLVLKEVGADKTAGKIILGQIQVEGWARQFAMPPVDHSYSVDLDNQVRFLGYDLSRERLNPGGTLHVTLYWQALSGMDTNYSVFVHLLDENNQVQAQRDSEPGGGATPTTGWIEGEIIADKVGIPLASQTLPGNYILEIGMYDAANGQRLSVVDEEGQRLNDRVLLGEVTIQP